MASDRTFLNRISGASSDKLGTFEDVTLDSTVCSRLCLTPLLCSVNGTLYIITRPEAPDCLSSTLHKANEELTSSLDIKPCFATNTPPVKEAAFLSYFPSST